MKNILLNSVFAFCLLVSACNNSKENSANGSKETEAEAGVYTCPMHPDVSSEQPGTCPECHMDLVKKDK